MSDTKRTSAVNTSSHRKAIVIGILIALVVIAVAVGVGFGVRAHQTRAAAASRAKAVAAARADCSKSVDRLSAAIRSFKSTADS